jgi:hypothetical protein
MLILSVGAASLLSLFAAAASTHRRAVDRTHAGLVAERVLGEVRSSYSPGRKPEELLAEVRAKLPESMGGYRYDLVLFHPEGEEWSPNELLAKVTVCWQSSGSNRAESFQALVLPRQRVGESRPAK